MSLELLIPIRRVERQVPHRQPPEELAWEVWEHLKGVVDWFAMSDGTRQAIDGTPIRAEGREGVLRLVISEESPTAGRAMLHFLRMALACEADHIANALLSPSGWEPSVPLPTQHEALDEGAILGPFDDVGGQLVEPEDGLCMCFLCRIVGQRGGLVEQMIELLPKAEHPGSLALYLQHVADPTAPLVVAMCQGGLGDPSEIDTFGRALGRLAPRLAEDGIERLEGLTADPDPGVRAVALQGFCAIPGQRDRAVRALLDNLDAPSPARDVAAEQLGYTSTEAAREHSARLIDLLNDDARSSMHHALTLTLINAWLHSTTIPKALLPALDRFAGKGMEGSDLAGWAANLLRNGPWPSGQKPEEI